ncbi:MAG: asparagine synthase [Verrucomicrobia bacterium]|nr:asparagine synthase [Verrucomicrobiota bacterium]
MSGIAGTTAPGGDKIVGNMLDKMAYRGRAGRKLVCGGGATLGIVCSEHQKACLKKDELCVQDCAAGWRYARAGIEGGSVVLERDPLGVAPLYYGRTEKGYLCFASEVKSLLGTVVEVNEMPPGCRFDGKNTTRFSTLGGDAPMDMSPPAIATGLRRQLEQAVDACLAGGEPVGAWLSGGLDSSAIAAIAGRRVKQMHTFAAGLAGAPDLGHAAVAAAHLKTCHHEVVVTFNDMMAALPDVIYHLESFDALLVRSSIMNYLAGKAASDHVPAVLSGEGGDELFAGYEYLKEIPLEDLARELLDITLRLHNTALQRVDRCSAAHGMVAHVPFLNPGAISYAMRISACFKIRGGVEKWILRLAMEDALPATVLNRPKAKFWEGTGVGELLSRHAEESVTNSDFNRDRNLPNGWTVRTKEELIYYRIFREFFGASSNLSWMGRTKKAPGAAG